MRIIITLIFVQCLFALQLAGDDCLNMLYDFRFSSDQKISFDFVCTKGTEREKIEFSFQEYLMNGEFRICSGLLQGHPAFENSKLILDEQIKCWEMLTNRVVVKKVLKDSSAVVPSLSLAFSSYRDGAGHSISFNADCSTNSFNEVFCKFLESYSNLYATVKAMVGYPGTGFYQSVGGGGEDSSMISFSDVFYTPFRYLRREVLCQGVLKKDDFGYFHLCPTNRELCGIDHLAHVHKLPQIHLEVPDSSQKTFNCNTGIVVSVRGTLSSLGDDNVGQHELESGFVCLRNPKIVPYGKSLSKRDYCTSCFYASPCREFKLKLHTSDGFICLVHYYSARLWVARYVAKADTITVYSATPRSVYATRKDLNEEKLMAKLWEQLRKIEACFQANGYLEECPSAGMFRAYPYSEIREIELRGEKCLKLQSTVLEIFEDIGVGLPCPVR